VTRRDLLRGGAALAVGASGLDAAVALLERAAASGEVAAAVLEVTAPGRTLVRAFGRARPDTVFLLASITKPMTAAAVMALVERGQLGLDDPVRKHLPEMASGAITVRHLLTHTSGLPDMLPDNLELRRRHAPLSAFVAEACKAPLLFAPGAEVRYQSMGFLLAAEIAQRITRTPFREHLRRSLLAPLAMKDTSLGLGGRRLEDTAHCQVPDDPAGWNSPYWRDLGSPWGGAHGTAADLTKLLKFFAHPPSVPPLRSDSVPPLPASARGEGRGEGSPLRETTVRAMLTPQTPASKKGERYGLGWRLGGGGKGCSPRTFGHSGATGTSCWMDPTRDLSFVLLTTRPSSESQSTLLQPVADLVSSAF
jgi:CubicO group peptidase (beta-lactamase class C family)